MTLIAWFWVLMAYKRHKNCSVTIWFLSAPKILKVIPFFGNQNVHNKLRWLSFPTQINDDSKLDSNKLRRWLYNDLNFKVKIVNYCIDLFSIKFNQLLIKFDHLLIIVQLKCWLKDRKWSKLVKNGQNWSKMVKINFLFDQFWLNFIDFWSLSIKSTGFQKRQKKLDTFLLIWSLWIKIWIQIFIGFLIKIENDKDILQNPSPSHFNRLSLVHSTLD